MVFISAISIYGLEFVPLNYRLPISSTLTTILPAVSSVVVLVLLVVFIQQTWRNSASIRTKLQMILVGIPIFTIIGLSASFVYNVINNVSLEARKSNLTNLEIGIEQIDFFLENSEADVLFLSQSTSLKNYLLALDNDAAPEILAKTRADLNADFFAFAQNRLIYDQIRYIDIKGDEIIRINTSREGISTIVPENELQNKSGRYYFEDTHQLELGKLMISPLDLNIENGEVEEPHKPVIRYGTPVIINGEKAGIILTNILAENFLLPLNNTEQTTLMVDIDGYYLYHPIEDKRWGRDLGTDFNLKEDYPDLTPSLFSGQRGNLKLNSLLFSYAPISIPGETSPRWFLINYALNTAMFSSIYQAILPMAISLVIIILVVMLLGIILSSNMTKPLVQLTRSAEKISGGDLETEVITSTSKDEIGVLATTFNIMTGQLHNAFDLLEKRIKESEKREQYLEDAAEVNKLISTIIDVEKLTLHIVELIQNRFGFYYVGLFRIDKQNKWAILKTGVGETGKIKVRDEHRFEIGKGIIGQCIRSEQAQVSLNMGDDETYINLPETQSEAILPLRSRGRILGVITVQSKKPYTFTTEITNTLQVMADQIAVALDNAELFAKSEDALKAERKAYGELSYQDWVALLQSKELPHYISDAPDSVRPLQTQNPTKSPRNDEVLLQDEGLTAIFPITIRGHNLGGVKLRKEKVAWTKEELSLAKYLVERPLSIALEGARLYDQSQRRAARERIIGEVSSQMRETLDIETILKTAVQNIHKSFNLNDVSIELRDDE